MEEIEAPLRANEHNLLMVGEGGKMNEFFACWSSGSMLTDAWNQHKFPKGRKTTEKKKKTGL